MPADFRDEQRKKTIRIRSYMDFTMGGLFIAIGIVLQFYKDIRLEPTNRTGLGILFILYGIWRIYRGYKKNYFK